MEEKKKYYSLHELEKIINLEEFTKDYCSDNGLEFDKLSEKYNGSQRNLERYASSHNLRRSKTFITNRRKQTNLKRYGTESPLQNEDVKNKMRQTNLDRYGVECNLQNEDIKNKIKQTNILKYGVENPLQNTKIKNKAKNTCLEKYGVENPNQNEDIKNKTKQTCLSKYGTESPLQNEDVKNKMRQTNLDRYGVEYTVQSNEIRSKSKQTCLEKYNSETFLGSETSKQIKIDRNKKYFQELYNRTDEQTEIANNKDAFINFVNSLLYDKRTIENIARLLNYSVAQIDKIIIKYNVKDLINYYSNRSKYEDEIIDFLKDNSITNIEHNKRTYLNGQEIDIYLPDYNVGIEFNGNYWHSDAIEKFQDHRGRSKYHQNKSLLAETAGIFLFHIFEYEWTDNVMRNKIKNRLKSLLGLNKNKIYGRDCEIKEIDKKTKQQFLDTYHLQGNDKSSIFCGLFNKNNLVAVMTFCKARFTEADWELSRYCCSENISVVGGASKLFNYFVNKYMKVKQTIVTYNDFAKTKGTLYEKLGFKYDHLALPNYVWINFNTNDILTRYQCRMQNETEFMHNNGYNRISDCGNKVWIYVKNKKED